MTTGKERIAKMIYFANPASRKMLSVISGSPRTLSEIVSATKLPREDVAAWLHEMTSKGVVGSSIEKPNSKTEATFALTEDTRKLVRELLKEISA